MTFPKHIDHRGKVLATIYRKTKSYPFYRVSWTAGGKRLMKAFPLYGDAKRHADGVAEDLRKGSQAAHLTAGQARDALAGLEVLHNFYLATGKRISLYGAAEQVTQAASKLNGHSLADAVDGFLGSVVSVKRIAVHKAIEDFIAFRKGKTLAAEGRRPQLSFEHWRNTGYWLREFAGTFPNLDVCDLTKQQLDLYMATFAKAAPKTRNERRGVVKMFMAGQSSKTSSRRLTGWPRPVS